MIAADPSHAPSDIQRRFLDGRALHRRALALLGLAFVLFGFVPDARARDLIRNGAFLTGSENTPHGWSTDQWSTTVGTSFEWKHEGPGIGVVIVRSSMSAPSTFPEKCGSK